MATTSTKQTDDPAADKMTTIKVPVGPVPEIGYISRHADVRFTLPDAEMLQAVVEGLQQGNHRLSNGRPVANGPDALRWLLEQIRSAG